MRRAFVVQLNPQTSEDPCDGRIEHVDSGQSRHFHSVDEAVSFVKQVLAEIDQSEFVRSDSDLSKDLRTDVPGAT